MACIAATYSPSGYKFVIKETKGDRIQYRFQIKGFSEKRFDTAREAAIAVDKALISMGKEPVNILKKKS